MSSMTIMTVAIGLTALAILMARNPLLQETLEEMEG
jgi:hypothetical protein